ncbi:hypothetical protein BASA81_010109 [Batrachochytrium salamandrivorans]|nr:hypothetical protein BASA81_010109 [Batrachochytrium salamandrivorans]
MTYIRALVRSALVSTTTTRCSIRDTAVLAYSRRGLYSQTCTARLQTTLHHNNSSTSPYIHSNRPPYSTFSIHHKGDLTSIYTDTDTDIKSIDDNDSSSITIERLENMDFQDMAKLGKTLNISYIRPKIELIDEIISHIDANPELLTEQGELNYDHPSIADFQVELDSLSDDCYAHVLHSFCNSIGIDTYRSAEEIAVNIANHISTFPSVLADNVDLQRSLFLTDDAGGYSAQLDYSKEVLIERLSQASKTQIVKLGTQFGISKSRSHCELSDMTNTYIWFNPSVVSDGGYIKIDNFVRIPDEKRISLRTGIHKLGHSQLRVLCDALGIPSTLTKNKLKQYIYQHLFISSRRSSVDDSVLQHDMRNTETEDEAESTTVKENDPLLHMSRLHLLTRKRLVEIGTHLGISERKSADELQNELMHMLKMNPSFVRKDGSIILESRQNTLSGTRVSDFETTVYINQLTNLCQNTLARICSLFDIENIRTKYHLVTALRNELRNNPLLLSSEGFINQDKLKSHVCRSSRMDAVVVKPKPKRFSARRLTLDTTSHVFRKTKIANPVM